MSWILRALRRKDLDESEEEDWMTYVDLMDLDGIDLLDWGFYIFEANSSNL